MHRGSTRTRLAASVAAASIALAVIIPTVAAAGPHGAAGQGRATGAGPSSACAGVACPNGSGAGAANGTGAAFGGRHLRADPSASTGRPGWAGRSMGASATPGRHGRATSGTLTAEQRAMVAYMAEEEKLAHDLYVELGSIVGGSLLPTIAESESRHLEAVRRLMAKHGIEDVTADLAEGAFSTDEFQDLYDDLLARGRTSLAAAYDVGEIVELDDIAELERAADGVTATDVLRVYANLTRGSERHLLAFQAH